MKKQSFKAFLLGGLLLGGISVSCISCSEDDNSSEPGFRAETGFIRTYAAIASANYKDSYNSAVKLQKAINKFIATPTETNQKAAKQAWLDARDIYGQTEAFRAASGPIDNEESDATWALNNEGQLNAWPLDENYIDYVTTGQNSSIHGGIIGSSDAITEELLISKNGEGAEENVSTGWHAIEFLLWGQDLNYDEGEHIPGNPEADGDLFDDFSTSGNRSFTDFIEGDQAAIDKGEAQLNADRRKQYLKVVTDLLVKDLKALNDVWAEGGEYRKAFEALPESEALDNILTGIGFISKGEVANERLEPAIELGQENEHSCFSDNTVRDMWANVNGLNNVIQGKYKTFAGNSLINLVRQKNATKAAELEAVAKTTLEKLAALEALDKPFDQIIHEETTGDNGPAEQLADALAAQGDKIAEIGKLFDLDIIVVGEEE